MPRFLIMLAIAVALVVSAATQAQTPQSLNWELVPGLFIDGYKMYVDRNSMSRTQEDGTDIAAGTFLLVPESDGMQFKNKAGKTVTAFSVVRIFGVDCANGIALPIMDMYFNTKTPTRETKPIGAFEYTNPKPIDIHPQSSILYKTLCAKYST